MTKAEVIASIARQTGIDKEDVKHVLEKWVSVVEHAVMADQRVHFSGFGSFFRKTRAKKIGRNISTNTSIVVQEHDIPCFKPSKIFFNKVKSSSV